MAREFLKNDEIALAGAKALASHWENNRGAKSNHGAYLKKITLGCRQSYFGIYGMPNICSHYMESIRKQKGIGRQQQALKSALELS